MEHIAPNPNLPSGYAEVNRFPEPLHLTEEQIPWLKEPIQLDMVLCKLQGGGEFLLASALKSHDDLSGAADAMSPQQTKHCNNMFYSRVAGYIQNGNTSSTVETFPEECTDFPIKVVKNKSGQRVYFGATRDEATGLTVIIKLGSCDKNKQDQVTRLLTKGSKRYSKVRSSK